MGRYWCRDSWWRQIIGRGAVIMMAALVVAVGTIALVRTLPHVLPADRPDSRRGAERRVQRFRPARERRVASLSRGMPDVALQFLIVGGIAWGGGRILRLHLKD